MIACRPAARGTIVRFSGTLDCYSSSAKGSPFIEATTDVQTYLKRVLSVEAVPGSMADAGGQRGEKWLNVAKAIAFELKPFSMPTRETLVNAGKSVRTNVGQVTAELKRVAPEAVRVVKGFNPLRTLGLFAWLCGWALFIWVEFGRFD